MRKMVAVLVMAGCLTAAGQASAHGRGDGGAVVGALVGGALLGAVVAGALNSGPAVAYQAPPVYAAPAPVYAQQPAGYCYSPYQQGYVPCAPAQPQPYGYARPYGW
ncbi:MAG TPA: ecotin precursor [Paraburkholderia sp.]|nr:ecotin precursor [Paraburkholderia sp.]